MAPLIAVALWLGTLIGTPSPALPDLRWVQGGPPGQARAVLIRFFTDTECPYCSATAPSLRELDHDFRDRGLVVVGIYTPKPEPKSTSDRHVRKLVREYGFEFPVAVDDRWVALRSLWLDRNSESEFTSASLLLDREGIVRFVHSGGAFAPGSEDYRALRAAIEDVLR